MPPRNGERVAKRARTAPSAGATGDADASLSLVDDNGAGMVTTLAGDGEGFVDGCASAARFSLPRALAFLPASAAGGGSGGALLVADAFNHRIRRLRCGEVTTVAGGGTNGFADGAGANARFAYPSGLALARDGRALFIADASNHRIRVIELEPAAPLEPPASAAAPVPARGEHSAEARVAGFGGLGSGGGAPTLAPMRFELAEAALRRRPPPHDAGNGNGADAGPRVVTIAGTGAKGGADGGAGYATLNDPVALAVDTTGDGTVYFVECDARAAATLATSLCLLGLPL